MFIKKRETLGCIMYNLWMMLLAVYLLTLPIFRKDSNEINNIIEMNFLVLLMQAVSSGFDQEYNHKILRATLCHQQFKSV